MIQFSPSCIYSYAHQSTHVHRYANRAKNIKNKPRINEDPKDALLREYQEEILRLKSVLDKRKRKGGRKRGRRRATSEGEGGLDWDCANEDLVAIIVMIY